MSPRRVENPHVIVTTTTWGKIISEESLVLWYCFLAEWIHIRGIVNPWAINRQILPARGSLRALNFSWSVYFWYDVFAITAMSHNYVVRVHAPVHAYNIVNLVPWLITYVVFKLHTCTYWQLYGVSRTATNFICGVKFKHNIELRRYFVQIFYSYWNVDKIFFSNHIAKSDLNKNCFVYLIR